MTFDVLHRDTECDCVADAAENTQGFFARRVYTQPFADIDFETYWEAGKRPAKDTCKHVCDHKAVSIYHVLDEEQPALIEGMERQAAKTASLSPGRAMPLIYMKFTCAIGTGMIKPSPVHHELPGRAHHSLFKCDTFTLGHIQPVEFVQLNVA
jgi:hypothetical protein